MVAEPVAPDPTSLVIALLIFIGLGVLAYFKGKKHEENS